MTLMKMWCDMEIFLSVRPHCSTIATVRLVRTSGTMFKGKTHRIQYGFELAIFVF